MLVHVLAYSRVRVSRCLRVDASACTHAQRGRADARRARPPARAQACACAWCARAWCARAWCARARSRVRGAELSARVDREARRRVDAHPSGDDVRSALERRGLDARLDTRLDARLSDAHSLAVAATAVAAVRCRAVNRNPRGSAVRR
eukprot:6182583-Pleurochrysis_carterae.AAC.2